MRRQHIGWGLIMLGLASLALAEPKLFVLDNGLRLVVEEDHSAPVATIQFFVGTGSLWEDNWLGSGLSHLLEHVISDGSETRTREQIEQTQARLGNNANAYTSQEVVSYYVITAGEQAGAAIDHIADYLFHPTFPPEAVETQKGIILREMARVEDDPERQLYQLFIGLLYSSSPAAIRVIGYPEQFRALTREDLVRLHRRDYVPANVVLVVVGDVRAAEIFAHVQQTLGSLPPRALRRPSLPPVPPQVAPRRAERSRPDLSRAYFMLGYPTVDLFSPDMYPLDVAAYILANGDSSRLISRLRDGEGLVDRLDCVSYTPAFTPGYFAVLGVTAPEKLPAAEKAILQELNRLQQALVSPAELARAKRQKEADLLFARTTTQGRAAMYGNDLLLTNDLHFSERYVSRIRQVTARDIRRVACQYFRPERYNFVALAPGPTRAASGASATLAEQGQNPGPASVTSPSAAATSTPAGLARPVQECRLQNGVRLLVQENHAVPVVNIFAALPGGLRFETEEKAGLTRLMAAMLVRGTKTRSRLQIARALENVGGVLTPYSGLNSFGVSAQVRREDLSLALELVADVLWNPSFPEAELAQQKRLQLAALEARADDVDTYGTDQLRQLLFERYPYRFPPEGTKDSIQQITRADLVRFHAALTRCDSLVLAIFGDTTFAEAKHLAERFFGRCAPSRAPALTPAPVEPPPAQLRQKIITRPQQQALLLYGFRAGTIAEPDRYAREVMSAVFAGLGYPGGRLHNTLRNAQLVYATFGYAVPGPDCGYYVIYAATAPEKLGQAQQEIARLVREMKEKPPSDEELALAKAIALATQAVSLESSSDRARAVALDVLYGLGKEEIFRYAEQIHKVTAAEVQAQAQRIFDWERRVELIIRPESPGS